MVRGLYTSIVEPDVYFEMRLIHPFFTGQETPGATVKFYTQALGYLRVYLIQRSPPEYVGFDCKPEELERIVRWHKYKCGKFDWRKMCPWL